MGTAVLLISIITEEVTMEAIMEATTEEDIMKVIMEDTTVAVIIVMEVILQKVITEVVIMEVVIMAKSTVENVMVAAGDMDAGAITC